MITKVKMKDLNIDDPFFDTLKKDYPNFEEWFNKKALKDCYCYQENNQLLALLLLKVEENEDYSDIKPQMKSNKKLKVSTFKVDIKGKRIGTQFMKIIREQAIISSADEIYVTIFDNSEGKKELIRYLEKFGFRYFGMKNEKESVYIKDVQKV